MIPLSIAPDLMEEAVLLAERRTDRDVARAFRRERDRIYDVRDPESRDAQFRALNLRWFARFGLQARVEAAVNEHAGFTGRLCGGRIVRAIARAEEGADLIDPASRAHVRAGPLLVLRLRPESLLDQDTLQAFLRHELMHVADMLDPAFGYERTLPPSDGGPSADNMLRDRYRVVWDATIDGRLARAGFGSAATRDTRLHEFTAAFAMLGEDGPSAFEIWWDADRPTHGAMVAFATFATGPAHAGAGRCPVCRFPAASLDDRVSRIVPPVVAAIREENPSWRIEQGLCSQCLDLYEARYGTTSDLVCHR
ncbi:MAG: hypothetical protein HY047_21575 [Acidobacteria bacterium]|nr:hypothetical protein [Acidobacteriota bacterium]